MIPRYTHPEMCRIWSDENKFLKWLEVEIATAVAEAEAGLIPRSAARAIRRKGRFSVERILEIEKKVKHDVIAFTTNVAENIGREGRYLPSRPIFSATFVVKAITSRSEEHTSVI